jgi:hypothetical protein
MLFGGSPPVDSRQRQHSALGSAGLAILGTAAALMLLAKFLRRTPALRGGWTVASATGAKLALSSSPSPRQPPSADETRDLAAFIARGPLAARVPGASQPGWPPPDVVQAWHRNAVKVGSFIFGPSNGDGPSPRPVAAWSVAEKARVFHMYLPVYEWIKGQVAWARTTAAAAGGGGGCGGGGGGKPRTVVVGLSCVQGGGKTTLVQALQHLLRDSSSSGSNNSSGGGGGSGGGSTSSNNSNSGNSGNSNSDSGDADACLKDHLPLQCAAVSIDDFYLTRADQVAVAAAHSGNQLLQVRGTFGTHDTALAVATLEALCAAGHGDTVKVPLYDKSAFQGQGDRAPRDRWPVVAGPVDVVLFEGWNLVRRRETLPWRTGRAAAVVCRVAA